MGQSRGAKRLFFNLTSVAHTPLGKFEDSRAAQAHSDAFVADAAQMAAKRVLFEAPPGP